MAKLKSSKTKPKSCKLIFRIIPMFFPKKIVDAITEKKPAKFDSFVTFECNMWQAVIDKIL